MSLKVKAKGTVKYLPLMDDIAPAATNFTATAGPKLSASEAVVVKWGPLCMISFIAKTTSVIATGETIFTLPIESSAIYAVGIFGNESQYGARVTKTKIEAINAIPSGEWIRGQIIYPSSW